MCCRMGVGSFFLAVRLVKKNEFAFLKNPFFLQNMICMFLIFRLRIRANVRVFCTLTVSCVFTLADEESRSALESY